MTDYKAAIVNLIMFDFSESPYTSFTNYWYDHETHYRLTLGKCYDEISREITLL